MATGTLTQWAVGTGHDYRYRDNFIAAVYRNNSLLGLLHPQTGQPIFPRLPAGDSAYRHKVQTAGNTNVAIFAEGAAQPVEVAQTYGNIAHTYVYFWGWIRISGRIRDIGNANYPGMPLIAGEFAGTAEDIRDLMNTTFMGTANSGLEVAVDSTTTYGGQARGSAAWWESSETAVSGALTKASLANIVEAAEDNDKGGKTGIILTARNQITNYGVFSGTPNTSNHGFRADQAGLRGGFDLEAPTELITFQGVPIVGLPDFTNDTWLGLDLRPGKLGPNVGLSVRREFEMRGPQMSGDDDVYEVSTAMVPVVHNPKLCWKNTGVTA